MGRFKSNRYKILKRELFLRDGDLCYYCGVNLKKKGVLVEIDHVIAKKLGGGDGLPNLCLCCRSCNSLKRGMGLNDFIIYLEKIVDGKCVDLRRFETILKKIKFIVCLPRFKKGL